MRNDAIETIKVKNLTVKVFQDTAPESPREYSESKMYCIQKRYSIGDQHGYRELAPLLKEVFQNGSVFLPIYHQDYGHASRISTDVSVMVTQKIKMSELTEDSDEDAFSECIDDGQCGVMFFDRESLIKCFGADNAETRAQALKAMESEIEEYNQWLAGEVYGFVVERAITCGTCEHTEFEEVDSCWGFYGLDYARKEGVDTAKHTIKIERKNKRKKPSRKQVDTGKPQPKGYVRQERRS